LVDVQLVGVLVTATSVTVAVVFYILNLRETSKNRKIALTTSIMQPFMTDEGIKKFYSLYTMEWRDLEDYQRKYDSRINPENFAMRMSMWNLCESLGYLYRQGAIDLETLYHSTNGVVQYMWVKFKPVIEMYRGTDFQPRAYENFQFFAEKLLDYSDSYNRGDDFAKRISDTIDSHLSPQ
jgi:hypothetical protein